MFTYSKLVAELDEMIQRMIFESYGVDKHYESHEESKYYLLRLMKYKVPETNESNIGFRPHTDKSFSAIIHQLYIDGLEIETKDGKWIPCDLLPHSFVYLAGDVLMVCHKYIYIYTYIFLFQYIIYMFIINYVV